MSTADSLPALVRRQIAAHGPRPILRKKDRGIWKPLSWTALGARIDALARALRASGFRPGEVAAVMSENRPELVFADLAILAAGGIATALYPGTGPAETGFILRDSGARVLFVENEQQLDKALSVRDACPALGRIVVFDMKGLRDLAEPMCESLGAFAARGEGAADEADTTIAAEAPAALVYTQGSTGRPKGIVLSHRNILFQIEHAARLFGLRPGDERLAVLPMAHVLERVQGLYLALHAGCISNYGENPDTLEENLQELKPTVLLAAPYLWERFHRRTVLAAAAAGPVQRLCYRAALAIGAHAEAARAGGAAGSAWTALARLTTPLILGNVRRALGLDRLRLGLVGANPISPSLVRWFLAIGVPLTEVYGLAESAGLAAASLPGADRPGTAGRPVPYGALRLAPDGEILIQGEHVSLRAWQGAGEAAAPPPPGEGWLPTGDLGVLEDGFLRIAGRREDVIMPSGGAAVLPGEHETELKTSPYIADALVIGTGRPFLSCLVMIDQEAVEGWAHAHGVAFTGFAGLIASEPVHGLIATEIERANAARPDRTPIRAFRIIDRRLDAEDAELTPLMRLRRPVVDETCRDLIAAIYDGA